MNCLARRRDEIRVTNDVDGVPMFSLVDVMEGGRYNGGEMSGTISIRDPFLKDSKLIHKRLHPDDKEICTDLCASEFVQRSFIVLMKYLIYFSALIIKGKGPPPSEVNHIIILNAYPKFEQMSEIIKDMVINDADFYAKQKIYFGYCYRAFIQEWAIIRFGGYMTIKKDISISWQEHCHFFLYRIMQYAYLSYKDGTSLERESFTKRFPYVR